MGRTVSKTPGLTASGSSRDGFSINQDPGAGNFSQGVGMVLERIAGLRERLGPSGSSRGRWTAGARPGPWRGPRLYGGTCGFPGEKHVHGYGFLSVENVPHLPAVF